MAQITLKAEEALVLVDFLLRFRDEEKLATEHYAEQRVLWDVCALLESQVPELLDPEYRQKLSAARSLIESDDWEKTRNNSPTI